MPGVLSRRQCWRRQPITQRSSLPLELQSCETSLSRSLSESVVLSASRQSQSLYEHGPAWATTGNLLKDNSAVAPVNNLHKKHKKSVMFSSKVHVILIPCVIEYESAGLAPLLWWTDDDYTLFKQFALEEVKEFMLQSKITDAKQAISLLYQGCCRRVEAVEDCCIQPTVQAEISVGVDCDADVVIESTSSSDEISKEKVVSNGEQKVVLVPSNVEVSTAENSDNSVSFCPCLYDESLYEEESKNLSVDPNKWTTLLRTLSKVSGINSSSANTAVENDSARLSSRRMTRYLMNK